MQRIKQIKLYFQTTQGILVSMWIAFFLFMASAASFMPYTSLYYESLEIPGNQIGQLGSIRNFVNFFSSILLAFLADYLHRRKFIMRICILGMIAGLILFPTATTFFTLLPVVILYSVFLAPTNSVITETTLSTLENPRDYSLVRMGGSVGWGLSVLITGLLVGHVDLGLGVIFPIHIFLLMLLLVFTWVIPEQGKKESQETEKPTINDVLLLMRLPMFLPWLCIIFLWGATESSISNFLFLHINEIGGSPSLMGLSISISIIGEIIALLLAKRIQHRVGSRMMIVLSFVVRIIWFLVISIIRNPVLLLVNQFVGGMSFSLLHAGSVNYINKRAPKRIGTTAQAIRGAAQFGLGGGFGALVSGVLYQKFGSVTLFQIMCVVSFFSFILALFLRTIDRARERRISATS